jgi:hypothetical protein
MRRCWGCTPVFRARSGRRDLAGRPAGSDLYRLDLSELAIGTLWGLALVSAQARSCCRPGLRNRAETTQRFVLSSINSCVHAVAPLGPRPCSSERGPRSRSSSRRNATARRVLSLFRSPPGCLPDCLELLVFLSRAFLSFDGPQSPARLVRAGPPNRRACQTFGPFGVRPFCFSGFPEGSPSGNAGHASTGAPGAPASSEQTEPQAAHHKGNSK